jgi:hypothetical protein
MMLARTSALAAVGLVVAAATLAGCPPGLSDPERFQSGCPSGFSVESMMRDKCSGSGCHSGSAPAAGLDLVSADAFARMYGKASSCGEALISPAGADQSLLLQKVDGTTTCGARMPLGGDPLADSDVACVKAWITEGIDSWMGPIPSDDADAGAGGSG